MTPEVVNGIVTESHCQKREQIADMIVERKAALGVPQLSLQEKAAVSTLRTEISE